MDRMFILYVAADKYDMQSLRQLCAEKLFVMAFGMISKYAWTAGCFKTSHFNAICDHFGEYPRDLWDTFCIGVMFCVEKQGNADALIDALEEHPKLALYLNKKLTKALSGEGSLKDKLGKKMEERDIPCVSRCCGGVAPVILE
jgi:hypothetical protein